MRSRTAPGRSSPAVARRSGDGGGKRRTNNVSGSIKSTDHGDSLSVPSIISKAHSDTEVTAAVVADSSSNENSSLSNFYLPQSQQQPPPTAESAAADEFETRKAQIQIKIERTKELIKAEQTSSDDNVNEYLKLSSNADCLQRARIKQVFEKKNAKSAQSIIHYGKKLEEYQRKLNDLSEYGVKHNKLEFGLKRISGMSSSVMAKPKEFAHLLKHKFGSADNLNDDEEGAKDEEAKEKSESKIRRSSDVSNQDDDRMSLGSNITSSDKKEENICREISSPLADLPTDLQARDQNNESSSSWEAMMQELMLHKEEVEHLREELNDQRQLFKEDVEVLNYRLQEESDRCDRLEEQMNDLTELHQHEVENIRSVVNDMEEKVQYQSEERLLDIKEHLQSLDTKVTSIEHQQQAQHLNLEGLDSSDNAKVVMMKLLSILITVIHVMLFIAGVLMGSNRRALVTVAVFSLSIYLAALRSSTSSPPSSSSPSPSSNSS